MNIFENGPTFEIFVPLAMATTRKELLSSFAINSVVRGYHVYKDIWISAHGEELQCQHETGNVHDLYAVSVMRRGNIVRHVSRKISTLCNLFIRKGGRINCVMTDNRQYSADLPQGGLEIPCQLVFSANHEVIDKTRRLLQCTCTAMTEVADKKLEPEEPVTNSDTPSAEVSYDSPSVEIEISLMRK